MRPLARTLVVLTVCMAFVVIVPISIFLAVVLTVCMA